MDQEYNIDTSDLQKKLDGLDASIEKKAEMLAEKVVLEVVNHATSLTDETKPGVNPDDGPRKVHPGGWGDVTSQLVTSIEEEIVSNGFEVRGIVKATAEYAEALDAKTGYDVLGGAKTIIRKALRKYQHIIIE